MREKPYKFVVRLPMSMRDQIADAAKHFRRSMNSEIISRLQRTFDTTQNEADRSVGDLSHPPRPLDSLARFQINDNNLADRSPPPNTSPSANQNSSQHQGVASQRSRERTLRPTDRPSQGRTPERDQERALLDKFRSLSAHKRAAILALMD